MKHVHILIAALLTLSACDGFVNPEIPADYPEAAEILESGALDNMPLAEDLPIEWAGATNNYPAGSDPWQGTPIERVPTGPEASAGYTPDLEPPAQWFNHLWGRGNRYLRYLAGFFDRVNDEFTYPVTKNRILYFSPIGGHDFTGEWVALSDLSAESNGANAILTFPLRPMVPEGAIIRSVAAWVQPASVRPSVGDRTELILFRRTVNNANGSITTADIVSNTDNGTTNLQEISMQGLSHVVTSNEELAVVYESGATGASGDLIRQLRVVFEDPGPRNF